MVAANKVTNKIVRTFILFMVLILLFPSTMTIAQGTNESKQRIYDYANLLTPEEVEDLENLSNKYSNRREVDIIILTTNNTEGKYVVNYMQEFYEEKALGYDKPHGNVAILTLDMENRDVYVSGFYKGKEYLDDNRSDMVRRKISPSLSNGDYYGGFNSFIKTTYKYMGIKPGVDPNNILFNIWFQLIVSLGIAGIVVGSMFYRSSGKMTINEGTYRDSSSSRVISRRDNYIRTSVSKHRRPSNNNSRGGSSGGGMSGGGGTTSGGHSHSGSAGKF